MRVLYGDCDNRDRCMNNAMVEVTGNGISSILSAVWATRHLWSTCSRPAGPLVHYSVRLIATDKDKV